MRKKIAKRKRKKVIALGAKIEYEGRVREKGCRRKEAAFVVKAKYKWWDVMSVGDDMLDAYNMLLEIIKND
jgi:hypothetical protein